MVVYISFLSSCRTDNKFLKQRGFGQRIRHSIEKLADPAKLLIRICRFNYAARVLEVPRRSMLAATHGVIGTRIYRMRCKSRRFATNEAFRCGTQQNEAKLLI